VTELHCNTATQ